MEIFLEWPAEYTRVTDGKIHVPNIHAQVAHTIKHVTVTITYIQTQI
jgi:hypothetical protein